MEFTWKSKKAALNARNHGVSFEQAQTVWNDPSMVIEFDGDYDGESRWLAIGQTDFGLLLVVVHVETDATLPVIHIISAWKATAYDENLYRESNA